MRKRQRHVFVEVSPTRYEIAVIEDGVLLGQRASRPAVSENETEWAAGLLALETDVSAWVAELDIAGCQTTVVYTGPDTAASVYDCPATAGEQRAKLAAKIAMAGTISFPIEQNAHAEVCLYKDTAAAEGEQPQLRTLAIADTEATILSLSMTLERAGLVPTSFVPAPGASLAAAIERLVETADESVPRVVLWIGEHSSVITAGQSGRVALARLVPVGTETLVEALARPVTAADHRASPLMDRDAARELLFTSGIPTADGWQDSAGLLDAQAVLPLVQPAVQRLIVELKQSIRFGLGRDVREQAKLIVCGPGSQILGLDESIAGGASLDMIERNTSKKPRIESIHGDIAAVLVLGSRVPSLVPRKFAAERIVRNTRKAIWAGAAMALLAIGADVFESLGRSSSARESLEQASTETTPLGSVAEQTMQAALAARNGLNHAQARERMLLDAAPVYAAVLAALSALTPEQVSLTEIAFAAEGEMTRCTIRGWALGDEKVTETDRFREFTTAIRSCPLIVDTKLGETRRTLEQERQKLAFSMTLDLVALPVDIAVADAEAAGDSTP